MNDCLEFTAARNAISYSLLLVTFQSILFFVNHLVEAREERFMVNEFELNIAFNV